MFLEGYRDISGTFVSTDTQNLIQCYGHVTLFQASFQIILSLASVSVNLFVIKKRLFESPEPKHVTLNSDEKMVKAEHKPTEHKQSKEDAKTVSASKFESVKIINNRLDSVFWFLNNFINVSYLVLCCVMNAVLLLSGPGLTRDFSIPYLMDDQQTSHYSNLSLGKSKNL